MTLNDLHISPRSKILPGIAPGYHRSMHAKNQVPRPFGLAVIDKCHVCDGHTDTQTDTQTENRHKLFLSLTFIDMTHINILILRHLVKIFHTDRQRKFIILYISLTLNKKKKKKQGIKVGRAKIFSFNCTAYFSTTNISFGYNITYAEH